MAHRRGYTLVEFAVTVVILAVTLAFLVSGIMWARLAARREQSSMQVTGIIQGLINYAPGGNPMYPGLKYDGSADTTPLPASNRRFGTSSINGYEPRYRFTVMLRNNYFSPEYAISPFEKNLAKSPARFGDDIDERHFSFAMLRVDEGEGRRRAWRATDNAKAVVVSDRNLGGAGSLARSIHDPAGPWRGTVGFHDMHVDFSETNTLPITSYNAARWSITSNDDLFADDNDAVGQPGHDAAMVYQDEKTYVNQK